MPVSGIVMDGVARKIELGLVGEQRFQILKEAIVDITRFWGDRANEELLNLHFFRGLALLEFKHKCEVETNETLSKNIIIKLSMELGLESKASTLYREMKFAETCSDCLCWDQDSGMDKLDLLLLQAKLGCTMNWRAVSLYGIREHQNDRKRIADVSQDIVDCNTLQEIIVERRPYQVKLISKSGALIYQCIVDENKGEI